MLTALKFIWYIQNRTQFLHTKNCTLYSTRWCYNGCNRVFACNFHILNNTIANLISICSLNRPGFSDIGHAHFCCKFHSLNRHICKTYFFKLLLQFKCHLPKTLHIQSPDVSNEKLSKEFWHSKKSATYNQAILFAS